MDNTFKSSLHKPLIYPFTPITITMIPENPLFCNRPVNVHIDIHTVLWQHLVVSYFATLGGEETQLWTCDSHMQKSQKTQQKFQHWLTDATKLISCLCRVHDARPWVGMFLPILGGTYSAYHLNPPERKKVRAVSCKPAKMHCSSAAMQQCSSHAAVQQHHIATVT